MALTDYETLAQVTDQQFHELMQLPWGDSYPLRRWAIWRAKPELL